MTKMMIRGGDLDLVEYDFSPFSIGENIRTCGMDERKYNIEPKPGKHTVKVNRCRQPTANARLST